MGLGESKTVQVNLIPIRHGFSCANKMKAFSRIPFRHLFYRDPELTKIGVDLSIKNGKALRATLKKMGVYPDILACSTLLRSMETAYYMFDHPPVASDEHREIYVVPYLAETGATLDNLPSSIQQQSEQLSSQDGVNVCRKDLTGCDINFDLVKGMRGRGKANYSLFLRWLGNQLPYLMKRAHNGVLNLAVVTHSGLMHSDMKLPKPHNNQAFLIPLTYRKRTVGDYVLVSDPRKGAIPINYGLDAHLPKLLSAYEPDRCSKPV